MAFHIVSVGVYEMDHRKRAFASVSRVFPMSDAPLPGVPLVEICNRRRVLVENHQGVSGYTSEEVQVNTAAGAICVSGRKLNLMKMTRFQLVITGEILAVTFKERN